MLRVVAIGILLGAAASTDADPYVTAHLGHARTDFSLDEPFNGSIDDDGIFYGVNLGYRMSDLLAVEVGASRFGGHDGRGTPCPVGEVCVLVVRDVPDNELNTYAASILPNLEMGSVELFGRLGYYHADIDTNVPFPNNEFTENGLLLGGGARWRVGESLSLSLEATAYDDDITRIGIAVGWHP